MSGIDSSQRDRPFESLKELELEQRSRGVAVASLDSVAGNRWVGVAFRMGGETFLAAREETREVLAYPAAVTRIPGAKPWIKGLANIRGQLMPILDLRQFLGNGATPQGRTTRIVVVNHTEILVGLMVDEVVGFRRFADPEFSPERPATVIRCDGYLAGAYRRAGEVWPVLSFKSVVESQAFLQAAS